MVKRTGNQLTELEARIERLIIQSDSMAAADLCVSALQQEIEVESIQGLIKNHNLIPKIPPFDVKLWPWKLKIYTLGRFSILLQSKTLNVTASGHNKSVEFLKVLVALGGRDVRESSLCAALWPDSEGDRAHSAFSTTLSRCRKLIGKELLLFQHGKLSLNNHLCWTDNWAFERELGEIESMLNQTRSPKNREFQSRVDSLFDLYHGPFMVHEPTKGWMLPQRERLQSKFMRIIKLIIQFYRDHGGQCRKVITLYEKAGELDPYSEEYCRGLMRCHAAQGNRSEALAIYDRSYSMWSEAFGVKPSDKTIALYQLIKSCEQEKFHQFCELCPQLSD